MQNNNIINQLIKYALEARENAYNSDDYKVGCSIVAADSMVFTGANVKLSYGLTCCAERIALFKALSEGYNTFQLIVLVTEDAATPCGSCRQAIKEICSNIPIVISDLFGNYEIKFIDDLLPDPFINKTEAK